MKLARTMAIAAILCLVASFHQAHAAPVCIAGYAGTPAPFMPRWERGSEGHHVFYWCKRPDGVVTNGGFSCRHGVCDFSKFSETVQAITVAASKESAASSAWSANITKQCDVPADLADAAFKALCVEREAILNANASVWLAGLVQPVPAPVYIHAVKNNACTAAALAAGTCSRPAYALTNGIRGTKEVARATVGQPCKDATGTADQWLTFGPTFTANVVALCARRAAP